MRRPLFHIALTVFLLTFLPASLQGAQQSAEPDEPEVASELPTQDPDAQAPEEEKQRPGFLKKMPKNLLLVPIPTSTPTFGTGLILGGAWFYSQTEEQKEAQPASYTGAAAGYTSNDSWFAGIMQQNYWSEDTWRFTGVAGYLDLKLDLFVPESGEDENSGLDWLVDGYLSEQVVDVMIRALAF